VDTNLGAAAVAIALVALVTLGQLFQQYFTNADGYRRCQQSVMGHWALKTRWRWGWKEFRFDTLYSTPEIFITRNTPKQFGPILITGSHASLVDTLVPAPTVATDLRTTVSVRGRLLGLPPSSNSPFQCSGRVFDFDSPIVQFSGLQISKLSWDF
jgi:hypothetical protein